MIRRDLEPILRKAASERPVVAVLGPRQSGKTTLVRATFPNHTYIDLDDLETQSRATSDPKNFLQDLPSDAGIILDEIQNVPEMFSYIKVEADRRKKFGYFILSGSQNLARADGISQSLAGRVAELTLMPLAIHELKTANLLPAKIEEFVYKGCYPELYQKNITISSFCRDYVNTYIKRDVRRIMNVENVVLFEKFMRACAVRTGQVLNQASIAEDLGIAESTVNKWISLLAATYVIFLLQPYNKKISKRLAKSPKLFFSDTGLACSLLGLRTIQEVTDTYLRGNLIETAIIADLYKQYCNLNYKPSDLYYFRTYSGLEVDAIIEKAPHPIAVEVKSGQTINPDFFKALRKWQDITKKHGPDSDYVIYGGDNVQRWPDAQVLGWHSSGHLIKDVLAIN